jgi:hypothetical protein
MTSKYNSEIQRRFGRPPIRRCSLNSLEISFLVQDFREFMMLILMDGRKRISIDAVIRRDGRWLSFKPPRISYLVGSQQRNGNPQTHNGVSISPAPTRSCSVWMRAANTLSPAEMNRLFSVSVGDVRCLGQMVWSYRSGMIPIITLTVGVIQIVLVSCCQLLKGVSILQWMEVRNTSNSNNSKSTKSR